MKSNRPVTMATIAREAGVARSTVSKALRDDPTIPMARCIEIKRLADELGYRANPMISALMAQLHSHRRRADPYHIAWLDLWRRGPSLPIMKPLLAGASKRAAELGYNIEVYCPFVDGITPNRLRQVLTSRSQWAVIIPPVPDSAMYYGLDLRGLAGVTIGTSLHQPIMHRVSPNHYQAAQLACIQLRGKGFKRIGLVLSRALSDRVEGKWMGAFLAERQQWPRSQWVEPLLTPEDRREVFERWLARQRPDALLIAEPQTAAWVESRVPVAWLYSEEETKRPWRIDYHDERLGAAAVELVIGQIHRNERGSPAIAHTLLLDSSWVE